MDLAADRTQAINRMRAQMLEYFPALERAFDYKTSKASLVLLTGYQTPAGLRRIGGNRLASWLKNRKVRNLRPVAATAIEAAEAQHTSVPGENLAAIVHDFRQHGPLPRVQQGPTAWRTAEGRDLSLMSGMPADISYRLLPV